MPVSSSITNELKNWLKEKHVLVPNDWVEACVEFLCQEDEEIEVTFQRLKDLVYSQWLKADLEEISVPCLQQDLNTIQKICLSGTYAMQINGIRDISKSAYSQLQQLDGNSNTNVNVSAAPTESLPQWELKPTRMLLLNLTDGVHHVKGMEYKPCTSLSTNLPPGSKVLITGPVECRYGILFLSPDKIKFLGGFVDQNFEKYSKEEILREALPGNDTFVPTTRNSNREDPEANSRSYYAIDNPRNQGQNNRDVPPQTQSTSYVAHVNQEPEFALHDNIDNFAYDDDDFAENLDYCALDEIERQNSQLTSTTSDLEVQILEPFVEDIPDIATEMSDEENSEMKYENLSDVLKRDFEVGESYVTIQGRISKVLSRLTSDDNGWHLFAKVVDETAFIEVSFHDKVLEKLIGMSASAMMAMKARSFSNEDVKKEIAERIANCKKRLQSLKYLFEIKFMPGEKPCVVNMIDNSLIVQKIL